eukprot:403343848
MREYGDKQKDIYRIISDFNNEKDDFDLFILQSKDNNEYQLSEMERLKLKIAKETQKQKELMDKNQQDEQRIKDQEEKMTKLTEELEFKNSKLQREKQWQREKAQEIQIWKKETQREEEELQNMSLQICRRKEMIQKKEINVMEWTKRNLNDRNKIDEEKSMLDAVKDKLDQDDQELSDKLRRLKKREFDELAKKAKIVEQKKENLKNLKKEEVSLTTQCTKLELDIQSMDIMIKNHFDMKENLDLKMLGLELSEEMWKKKCEEQQRQINIEKHKLDELESKLKHREINARQQNRELSEQRKNNKDRSTFSNWKKSRSKVASSTKSLKLNNNMSGSSTLGNKENQYLY